MRMYGWGTVQAARRFLAFGIVLALALEALPAGAQEWLRDRRYSQGPGIMLSDSLVFHPGIALEGGYDTNVFYAASDDQTDAAGRLRVTGQLEIATLPPQRTEDAQGEQPRNSDPAADFFFNVAAAYNQYLSAAGEGVGEAIMKQSDVGLLSGLDLTVFPRRTWSFLLRNTFQRTIDPGNDSEPGSFNRDYDSAEIGLRWGPGGGAFELKLLGGVAFNFFEEGGTVSRVGDYISPRGRVEGRWRFFPNSALTFETSFAPILKENGGDPDYGNFAISSSYPIRALVGMTGQWTPVIATALRVGYGAGFYDLGEDFESVIAQAEVDFILGLNGRIRVGFVRDFVDSFFSNFYVRNEGFVGWDHLFAGSFLLGIRLAVGYLQYATLYYADNTVVGGAQVTQNPRADTRLAGTVYAEYRLKDWLGFNATVTFEDNLTDFHWQTGFSRLGARAEDYWKLTAFLGARFIY
jgi:hypothetical protein